MNYIETKCCDCGKNCDNDKDWLSFFDNSRCAKHEAEMFRAMEEADQDEKVRTNTF